MGKVWSEDSERVVAFCSEEKDGYLLFPWAGKVSVAVHGLGGGFLGDHALEVRVRDDVVGDEHGVGEAEDQECDGWRKGVGLWDWKEDEEGLESGSDEEEGAE